MSFLFTDIEGSTGRWERDRDAMATALRRHDELSAQNVNAAGGSLFKNTGDGCCAAFSDVASALQAATALRDDLATEDWPESVTPIRVRMAIHSGPAEERGGDYFGPTLNRAARLMSAGHGGQILLSAVSRELLVDKGPELRDLGDCRLRDLLRAEHVYQVDDLTEEFPPLRALKGRTHSLPVQLSPFLGRDRELREVIDLVGEHRLVTLTGPGGTGKTRLALQAAAEILDAFDGVYFVDLSHIRAGAQLPSAIVDSVGFQGPAGADDRELLLGHFSSSRALIIFDNFEHVIDAAPLIGSLLGDLPAVHAVVTSRELLRVGGERHYPVPPLSVPPDDSQPVEVISSYEAVRLFADRARASRPDFTLDDQNSQDVSAICRRLDGLPLAIELAAARIRLFTATQIREQVEAGIGSLRGGPVDSPERHQTLIDTIRWSYDLLDGDESRAFRRMAVFVGGCSLEAVGAVCLHDLEVDASTVAEALADKSLVRLEQGRDGSPRVELLSMIHSFALTELEASGELEHLRSQHLAHYVQVATSAEPELRGRDHARWMALLEDERPNLDAALAWSFASGEPTGGLRLVAALRDFWFYQGHLGEMSRWVDLALAHLPSEEVDLRAGVFLAAGFRASALQDKDAVAYLEQAAEHYGEVGDDPHCALALIWGGGDRHGLLGDLDGGRECVQQGLELARRSGSLNVVAQGLNMLGEMERVEGNYELAREIQQECLDLSIQTGERRRVAMVSNNLGLIAHHLGDDETADHLIRQALEIAVELEFEWLVAYSLMTLAEQIAVSGSPEVGAQLIGAADAYYERSGMKAQTADAMDDKRIRVVVGSSLGEARYEDEVRDGRRLSLRDAAALVLLPDTT